MGFKSDKQRKYFFANKGFNDYIKDKVKTGAVSKDDLKNKKYMKYARSEYDNRKHIPYKTKTTKTTRYKRKF